MSGIVGVIGSKSEPVDAGRFEQMLACLEARGPHGTWRHVAGPAALGHTLLRTARTHVPVTSPDGSVLVVADVRLDARPTLLRKLKEAGQSPRDPESDAELLLRAYELWELDCVAHLLGDFAFAIWDERRRRLFLARDHFGIKPLYYHALPRGIVFSNTFAALRAHPAVSSKLNEQAVADFLLFGFNLETETTILADMQRLPPAHRLIWTEDTLRVERYWQVPQDLQHSCPHAECVERFVDIFTQAVADRITTDQIAITMSGGLDSTMIASVASTLRSTGPEPVEVTACTGGYDHLVPDKEKLFARQVAEQLGLAHEWIPLDEVGLLEGNDNPALYLGEPYPDARLACFHLLLRRISDHGSVVLDGTGGDDVMLSTPNWFPDLLRQGRIGQFVQDLTRAWRHLGKRPVLNLRRLVIAPPTRRTPPLPEWLENGFRERLEQINRVAAWSESPRHHPTRPNAWARLSSPRWSTFFEYRDPGSTGVHLEFRYPFLDVRLVEFLLEVPPTPWFTDKELLRTALKGRIPEAVRLRPKSPAMHSPISARLRNGDPTWQQRPPLPTALHEFINPDRFQRRVNRLPELDADDAYSSDILALSLSFWVNQHLLNPPHQREVTKHARAAM